MPQCFYKQCDKCESYLLKKHMTIAKGGSPMGSDDLKVFFFQSEKKVFTDDFFAT